MKCTKVINERILFISMSFLEIVQLFDPSYSEKVKKKKFKVMNKDFVKHVEDHERHKHEVDEDMDNY